MGKIFILIFAFFSFSRVGYAEGLEKFSFVSPEKEGWQIYVLGYFKNPGSVSPNEDIFSVTSVNRGNGWLEGYQYKFTGRTGEKTFEMQYISSNLPSKFLNEDKKINMYFDETLYDLSSSIGWPPVYSGCKREDKIFLKMIKLQGNQLEYQIIIPDCLIKNK